MSEPSEQELSLYEMLEGLNANWTPHTKQIDIGHALFYENAKNIFICAGRNFGKTEISAYCTWRWAMQYPGSQNYIFEPYAKQAREILWVSNRIQTFGPKDWIQDTNATEMRITFKNGSFIKLEGSDNVAAIAGIKPKGLIVYDEFKDHRPESISNFEPNRAAFDVPALFIGTPPMMHNHFVDYMEFAKQSSDWKFFHAPTASNPHIKSLWLSKMKEQMTKMGMIEDYLRDYEAIFVKGGKASIYPWVLTAKKHKLDDILPSDLNKWTLIVALDPAATSVFGCVFAFHNPYTKRLIIFDEIYEDKQANMTSREIWRQIDEKLLPWRKRVKDIEFVLDEAAAYFTNETSEVRPNYWLNKTQKHLFGVDGYINMVRTVMAHELIMITDNCVKWWWEHENYQKDEKGKIPKANDHLINGSQYLCAFLGYDLSINLEPKPIPLDDLPRYRSIEQDLNLTTSYAEID